VYVECANSLFCHSRLSFLLEGVCTSGLHKDLQETDAIAADILKRLSQSDDLATAVKQQYDDNISWIQSVESHKLVVGSEARILYSNSEVSNLILISCLGLSADTNRGRTKGRTAIALAFNHAIASGRLKGPVMLSRDHHDVSGTDSPFRETSNIQDGSMFCAGKFILRAT
jgi:urocanate hydratase